MNIPRSLVLFVSLFASAVLAADEAPKAPREGYKVPDFTLNKLDGTPLSLFKVLEDSSVLLVVLRGYPGYQCPICSVQVGDLLKHEKELADAHAQVILVYPGPAENLDQRATEFLKSRKLPDNFTMVVDPDYTFTNAYGLRWDAPAKRPTPRRSSSIAKRPSASPRSARPTAAAPKPKKRLRNCRAQSEKRL